MRNQSWLGLGGFIAALSIALVSCTKTNGHPSLGTNTNWLMPCSADADCDEEGASCLCGLCTRPCTAAAQCGEVAEDARCTSLSAMACTGIVSGSACLRGCDDDGDCGDDGRCHASACVPRAGTGEPLAGNMSPPPDAGRTQESDGGSNENPSSGLRREGAVVVIPPSYTECTEDADCTLVDTGCNGCCQRAAINGAMLATYMQEFALACAGYMGGICNCAPSLLAAACEQNTCRGLEASDPKACYSPGRNPELAGLEGVKGCPCERQGDTVCIGDAAMSCERTAAGELAWRATEELSCLARNLDPDCQNGQRRPTLAACLEEYQDCFQLDDGAFCGAGCVGELDCATRACTDYAPIAPEDCSSGFGAWEGLCKDGRVRWQLLSGGFTGSTRFYDADTGALLATQESSDAPSYCMFTAFAIIRGDVNAVYGCEIVSDQETAVCSR